MNEALVASHSCTFWNEIQQDVKSKLYYMKTKRPAAVNSQTVEVSDTTKADHSTKAGNKKKPHLKL